MAVFYAIDYSAAPRSIRFQFKILYTGGAPMDRQMLRIALVKIREYGAADLRYGGRCEFRISPHGRLISVTLIPPPNLLSPPPRSKNLTIRNKIFRFTVPIRHPSEIIFPNKRAGGRRI